MPPLLRKSRYTKNHPEPAENRKDTPARPTAKLHERF
jgi:hypothetical protein